MGDNYLQKVIKQTWDKAFLASFLLATYDALFCTREGQICGVIRNLAILQLRFRSIMLFAVFSETWHFSVRMCMYLYKYIHFWQCCGMFGVILVSIYALVPMKTINDLGSRCVRCCATGPKGQSEIFQNKHKRRVRKWILMDLEEKRVQGDNVIGCSYNTAASNSWQVSLMLSSFFLKKNFHSVLFLCSYYVLAILSTFNHFGSRKILFQN